MPILEQRGPEELMRPPLVGSFQESLALDYAFFPNDPLREEEARAPPIQATRATSPPTSAEGFAR